MKVILFLISILCFSLLAQDSTLVEPQTGTLVVIFTDIPGDKGHLRIALTESKADFEASGSAYRTARGEIIDGQSQVIFSDLPHGDYAIKVYHDENEDGELDTNFLGIPSEAYGFSNDARGSFGPASWEDAVFMFNSQTDSLFIIVE